MDESKSWLPWALMSAGFAALTAIFAKIGVQEIDSFAATLIRTIIISVILACFIAGPGTMPNLHLVSARSYIFLGLSALATGASWLCYFRALQLGDAARVAPIDKFSVVVVAIFATIFLGESLSLINWIGISLTALGLVLVALG